MKTIRIAILLAGLFVSWGHAHANVNENYIVKNVAVDVESDSAVSARNKALINARRNAFNVLKSRLLSGNHNIAADDRQIAMMVDSFEINREKLSKNRYLASVNVRFSERAVNSFLSRQPTGSVARGDLSFLDGVLTGNAQSSYNNNGYSSAVNAGSSRTASSFSYDIVTKIKSLRDYMMIKNKLAQMPMVVSLRLVSLSSHKAVLSIHYQGGAQQFQNDLGGRNMQLYSNPRVVNGEAPYILISRG